jgi:hypothetical protein
MLISLAVTCRLQPRTTSFTIFSATFTTSSPLHIKKRMPPKKQAQAEKKVLLGRPGNNLKVGIVGAFMLFTGLFFVDSRIGTGLPNVGKSSFFNALSETGTSKNSGIARNADRSLKTSAKRPTSHMPPSTPKKRAFLSPTRASSGYARHTSLCREYRLSSLASTSPG